MFYQVLFITKTKQKGCFENYKLSYYLLLFHIKLKQITFRDLFILVTARQGN